MIATILFLWLFAAAVVIAAFNSARKNNRP